ncbi:sensor histidine kinase [Halobium palmae]|uniref:histidine kinase n=1 Tax=Halobium palmae TaxID=1776492 RepID=A0ABD5RVT4_9EURY
MWLFAGVGFGLGINQWFFLIISLEQPPPGEPIALNANGIAAAVTFTALIGYFYTRLNEQNRVLRETNERLEDFASVVSHDLRNPLNIVQGHLDLARETGDERHFDAMDRATARMEQLICQVLTLTRTDGVEDAIDPAVDVGTVAQQAASTVETGDLDVRIETDAVFEANAERLRSLFENLIHNTVVHGAPTVTSIRIGELCDGDGFFVEDDGPGIPPEARELVFEGGYSTTTQGSGFGLSIVRRIAVAHGWSHTVTEGRTGGARIEISGLECEESRVERPVASG